MKLTLVAGARPNFMKIAPLLSALREAKDAGQKFEYKLVHTGQHFDKNMSGSFFEDLHIPLPDANLECGGGSHAEQTASIMVKFEQYLQQTPTDLVLVVGDVTSTMACTITAKKLNIDVAHVEAGIRSGDMTMPEEINRIVTDSIADYFFTTSRSASDNLLRASVPQEHIFFVGNTMIDTLLYNLSRLRKPSFFDTIPLQSGDYLVLTLHRPNNVDQEDSLKGLLNTIIEQAAGKPIVFPVHPRTAKKLAGLGVSAPNLFLAQPMGYLEFNFLVKNCQAVITDSGGITEETTIMGIPCITLRNSTERPETVTVGTNELIGTNPMAIPPALQRVFSGTWKKGAIPELWDGKTAKRIVAVLDQLYNS
jgi:UDP-N-acetylglucosamine 2-epimerase (non-hydrolysing)